MAKIISNYDIEYESTAKKFISQDIINDMLSKVSIVDIMNNEYGLVLFPGRNNEYSGSCPFPDHRDSTPSFFVNEEKGLYRCFGCGRGGSLINCFMELDGLTFKEAISKLSALSGVKIDGYDNEINYVITQTVGLINKYTNYFDSGDLPCGLGADMFFKILAERLRQFEQRVNFDTEELKWVEETYRIFDELDNKSDHKSMTKRWDTLGKDLSQRLSEYRKKHEE